jgi:RNA polymerase sigma factor (TIGR02999 family)
MSDVTSILAAIEHGDPGATGRLLPLVYEELRRLAAAQLGREQPGQTLQPTALVHEAYLRLLGGDQRWANQRHFFAAAAEAMRRILIENARRKKRLRHGGSFRRIQLEEDLLVVETPADHDLLALDDALARLAREDPQAAELVNLRFFAGLSLEQAGAVLGLSRTSAYREWEYARAWLRAAIDG